MGRDIRSFVAVELSQETKSALLAAENQFRSLDVNVKWVKPENIHLTLKFLGNVPPKKMKMILQQFPVMFQQNNVFSLELSQLGTFPTGRHPKVVWAGVEDQDSGLSALVDIVENEFARLGFKKESRKFQAHATIGRLRSGKNCNQLVEALTQYQLPTGTITKVHSVTLFKSTLTPQGPIYEVLEKAPLAATPDPSV